LSFAISSLFSWYHPEGYCSFSAEEYERCYWDIRFIMPLRHCRIFFTLPHQITTEYTASLFEIIISLFSAVAHAVSHWSPSFISLINTPRLSASSIRSTLRHYAFSRLISMTLLTSVSGIEVTALSCYRFFCYASCSLSALQCWLAVITPPSSLRHNAAVLFTSFSRYYHGWRGWSSSVIVFLSLYYDKRQYSRPHTPSLI
jgi:hypothetical protein